MTHDSIGEMKKGVVTIASTVADVLEIVAN